MEGVDTQSAYKPAMQNFARLQIIATDASRFYTLLPSNPQLLPLFIGAMQELFRMPRAMAYAVGMERDSDAKLIDEIDKQLRIVREKAFSETEKYIESVRAREDYSFDLKLYIELNDVYDLIYILLAKKGLLTQIDISMDIKEAMKTRTRE